MNLKGLGIKQALADLKYNISLFWSDWRQSQKSQERSYRSDWLYGADLPKKLTGSQQVKKLSEFFGTRRFITAFTSVRYLSLPWARSIRSMPFQPISLILFSQLHLGSASGVSPLGFPTKTRSVYRPDQSNYKQKRQFLGQITSFGRLVAKSVTLFYETGLRAGPKKSQKFSYCHCGVCGGLYIEGWMMSEENQKGDNTCLVGKGVWTETNRRKIVLWTVGMKKL
jgi:hypothetical protein